MGNNQNADTGDMFPKAKKRFKSTKFEVDPGVFGYILKYLYSKKKTNKKEGMALQLSFGLYRIEWYFGHSMGLKNIRKILTMISMENERKFSTQ